MPDYDLGMRCVGVVPPYVNKVSPLEPFPLHCLKQLSPHCTRLTTYVPVCGHWYMYDCCFPGNTRSRYWRDRAAPGIPGRGYWEMTTSFPDQNYNAWIASVYVGVALLLRWTHYLQNITHFSFPLSVSAFHFSFQFPRFPLVPLGWQSSFLPAIPKTVTGNSFCPLTFVDTCFLMLMSMDSESSLLQSPTRLSILSPDGMDMQVYMCQLFKAMLDNPHRQREDLVPLFLGIL